MSVKIPSPRETLLTRLLQAHEHSVSYRRPAPWPRDVILRLDARTCPEAFAPDGREKRALLVAAARELQADGCLRVVHHARGPLTGEPKELRLGPEHVDRAYQAAQQLGFESLAVGLGEVARHAIQLATQMGPMWMGDFLEKLAAGARDADLSLLGVQRGQFKREWRELLPALTVSAALAKGITPGWERVVSERLLGDSKLLGRVRFHIVEVLVRADPRWDGVPPEEATDLLEAYGVRRKPGLIRCAGAATMHVGARAYRLEDFAPVAHLPEAWADAWVDAVLQARVEIITTVENEYPFLAYVEEAGGPIGVGARRELVVYTAGFPTPALVGTLARLSERGSSLLFRHWGDADVGGIRIWYFLRSRLKRSVEFFRTTPEWVTTESTRGGKHLSGLERGALARLRAEIEPLVGTDVATACELIHALLKHGTKLEQERF